MQRTFARVLALVLVVASAVRAQPLPTDPRLVTGTLDNGLGYIVRKHDNPPGRAAIWLHVSTGSLNETDKQRGIAHYTEHMAFNGSEHFPPGSVIGFFQSLGLTFGQHQNAGTNFDATVYQLALPDAKPETVQKGMLFLSDVALKLQFLPTEIENERQVILEERRTRLGGEQRIQDKFFEQLAPGSIFGQRIPIGIEETIKGVGQRDFFDYYKKWYTPSNMTLMVVADADTAPIVEQIKTNFSGGAKTERPTDQDIGIKPYDTTRAIVLADAEINDVQIGVMWLYPPEPPATTVELVRRDQVDAIAGWCFNRRLQKKVAEGKVSFQGGGGGTTDLFHAAKLATITVSGEPSKWKAMLTDLATETQRAHLHGFTDLEIDDARKVTLASAERAVEVESTTDAGRMLTSWNGAISAGEPITSAQQDLDIVKKILPTITAAEVSKRFNALFDTAKPVTFNLQIPSSGEVPTEAQLLELGRKALEVKPENEVESARPTAILEHIPEAGKFGEVTEHAGAAVTSAWLSNNARFHYRFMDYKKDQVIVTIMVTGGEIQETAANRGISQAAGLALSRPATGKLSSTNIRDLMTGKKVGVVGRPAPDAMLISVSGSPADLEAGMQQAYAMLTDPLVEKATLDKWKEQIKQQVEARKKTIEGAFGDLFVSKVYPKEELRQRPLEPEQVDTITSESATAWLKKVFAEGSIEVAIVGDLPKDRAMELAARYVGSLPTRPRISDATLADLRKINRPKGPLTTNATFSTATDKAVMVSGFFGVDAKNLRDSRLMNMATMILTTRAIEDIREKRQLSYAPQVGSSPATEYPGYGLVALFTETEPAKLASLLKAADDLYAGFSKDGPTAEELETAKKQIANKLDEQMRRPDYWSTRLTTMDYRATKLDDLLGAPAAYQSLTADEIREAFNRYYKPEGRFELSLAPAAAGAASPDKK